MACREMSGPLRRISEWFTLQIFHGTSQVKKEYMDILRSSMTLLNNLQQQFVNVYKAVDVVFPVDFVD